MAQIQSPETYADGQQVTAARLNNQTNGAILLPGAVTDQAALVGDVATDDTVILHDTSETELRKATVGSFLSSGFPVVTDSVTATANADIAVTPNDGSSVFGSNYVSADGLTVVVTTLAAHGLLANQIVLVSGAGSGYNGTFKITAVTSTTFTYVLYTAATPTASPTACTFVRKASVLVAGSEVITGSQFVNGEVETLDLQVDGQANINSSTIKSANITSSIQYNGVPVLSLVSVTETPIPFASCNATTEAQRIATCNQWRDVLAVPSLTKTNKELWEIEVNFPVVLWSAWYSKFRVIIQSSGAVIAHENLFFQTTSGAFFYTTQIKITAIVPEGTVLTDDSLVFQFRYQPSLANASSFLNVGFGGPMTDPDTTRTFRITRYAKP